MLEADSRGTPGTADLCMDVMDVLGDPQVGWCVGDQQTRPGERPFDNSPFAIGRGFDLIVPRDTMNIEWVSTHGTPGGNDNLDGEDVLAEVQRVLDTL